MIKMRHLLSLGLGGLLALSACSSEDDKNALIRQAFNPAHFVEADPTFLALAQKGAPAQVLSIERREQAYTVILRQTVNHRGEESWISGEGLSVGMKDGMILSTRGFGGDLMAADPSRIVPFLRAGRDGISELFLTHLTANDETELLAFRCRISNLGPEDVDLGGRVAKTRLMKAECRNGTDAFENLYWVDQRSSEVVQSRQWISAYLGTLATRVIPGGVQEGS